LREITISINQARVAFIVVFGRDLAVHKGVSNVLLSPSRGIYIAKVAVSLECLVSCGGTARFLTGASFDITPKILMIPMRW
jgi:hypothetical protein